MKNYTELLIYHKESGEWLVYIYLSANIYSFRRAFDISSAAGCFVYRDTFYIYVYIRRLIYILVYSWTILILSDFCEWTFLRCLCENFQEYIIFFCFWGETPTFSSRWGIGKYIENLAIIKSSNRRVKNRIVSSRCRSEESWKECHGDSSQNGWQQLANC